jgi:hypothetical protein
VTPDLSPWQGPARDLASRIVAFIDSALDSEPSETFDALALDLHRYQIARCEVRSRLTDAEPTDATEIPAIPVSLYASLAVGTVPDGEAPVAFRTSGTTSGARGVHRLRSTALYDYGATRWARRHLVPWPHRSVNLLLDPTQHPDSSLSHMIATFAADACWVQEPAGIDVDRLRAALARGPAFVATTAFALAQWLDHDPAPLPTPSTLMITGGFKGRESAYDADTLIASASRLLRPAEVVLEYGMTELSSQLWAKVGEPYHPPPWLRALAVDPVSEVVLPAGAAGQLRFIDLCNLDSSVAIETLDHGYVTDDGGVVLLGRLPGSEARGCSLTAEDALRGGPR